MAGVYISYPFCAQKCTYCNFASGVEPRELEVRYIDRVRAELRAAEWPWTPETVYLGGGTPSQMDAPVLAQVLGEIPGREWREATMEAAPGSFSTERIKAWRDAGINRVSLGVQSFVEKELARTGRKHTAETVTRDIDALRDAGIRNVNVDLIAGLPFQTLAGWNESLDWIEKLGVPHVSVYMLEVDEDSNLGRELLVLGQRYGARNVPCEDEIADFYELAVERLRAIRNFQLRATWKRIAAQFEVLAPGAVPGLRRGRPFFRRRVALAERGMGGGVLCRCAAGKVRRGSGRRAIFSRP